jgi:FixJ family two-component response regulator
MALTEGGARGLAVRAVGLMPITVYVIDPDLDGRKWIESALAPIAGTVVVLDDGAALVAHPPAGEGACLIATTEPDETATLELVRELRGRGATLPVIVLGPHSAFRTAVDIARFEATDFLERPVSVRQLRAAVTKACKRGA